MMKLISKTQIIRAFLFASGMIVGLILVDLYPYWQ